MAWLRCLLAVLWLASAFASSFVSLPSKASNKQDGATLRSLRQYSQDRETNHGGWDRSDGNDQGWDWDRNYVSWTECPDGCGCPSGEQCYQYRNDKLLRKCFSREVCGSGWNCDKPLSCSKGGSSSSVAQYQQCGWSSSQGKNYGCCKQGYYCAYESGEYSLCLSKENCDNWDAYDCSYGECGKGKRFDYSRQDRMYDRQERIYDEEDGDFERQDARMTAMSGGGNLGDWARCGWNADAQKQEGCCKSGWICAEERGNNGRYSQCQPVNGCNSRQFDCSRNACQSGGAGSSGGNGGGVGRPNNGGGVGSSNSGGGGRETSCARNACVCSSNERCYHDGSGMNGDGSYKKAFCLTRDGCFDYKGGWHGWDCHNPVICNHSGGGGRGGSGNGSGGVNGGGGSGGSGRGGGGHLGEWARCGWNADAHRQEGCCKSGWICAEEKGNGRYSQCQPVNGCNSMQFECGRNAC